LRRSYGESSIREKAMAVETCHRFLWSTLHSRNRSRGMADTVMAYPIYGRKVFLSLERF
jgi:hypothetical protein